MPATRPANSISNAEASPISAPPMAAESGVKLAMVASGVIGRSGRSVRSGRCSIRTTAMKDIARQPATAKNTRRKRLAASALPGDSVPRELAAAAGPERRGRGQHHRAEHRHHHGAEQVAREIHGADRDAEMVALDHVLHRRPMHIDGVGPKPAPIRNSSTSNDSSVRRSAHSASNSTDADRHHHADHRKHLVVRDAAQHLAADAGADVEADHQHDQAQAGVGRRKSDHALQIDRQEDVEADDRAPSAGIGDHRPAHDRIVEDRDRDQRLGRGEQSPDEQAGAEPSAAANSSEHRRRRPGDSARRRG